MFVITIITILVILLLLYLLLQKTSKIPRRIWTFWDSEEIPEFIQRCIQTWRDKNPNYEVIVLGPHNLDDYLSDYELQKINTWKYNDCVQKYSDLIRLSILPKYGGIWLDASIVCYENFDWVQNEGADCLLYSIPELSKVPLIESWFIACTQNNDYVKRWRDEFMRVEHFSSIDDYVSDISIDMTGINYNNYLLVYICARKVYLENSTSVKILNASEGPYKYHKMGGLGTLCHIEKPKFYKFRKEDRANLTDEMLKCLFN